MHIIETDNEISKMALFSKIEYLIEAENLIWQAIEGKHIDRIDAAVKLSATINLLCRDTGFPRKLPPQINPEVHYETAHIA